jgi:hypothetical protein
LSNTHEDSTTLQTDLDNLQKWEEEWLMLFKPDKCEVLRITNKRKNIVTGHCTIHNQALNTVDNAKYLGVTINKKLHWGTHIDRKIKKANSTLGFLRRNLRDAPVATKAAAYKTYVRPSLEYASTVWAPHQLTLVRKLEGVQRRAARYATNNYDREASVTSMLKTLGWQTLARRRYIANMSRTYMSIHGLIAIPLGEPYLQLSDSTYLRGRAPVEAHNAS